MHIAEGFLPVGHAVGWTVAAAPFVVHGAWRVNKLLKEKTGAGLLLGAAGAFTFVLSALKIPSVTGSTSHPTGTGLGTVLVSYARGIPSEGAAAVGSYGAHIQRVLETPTEVPVSPAGD